MRCIIAGLVTALVCVRELISYHVISDVDPKIQSHPSHNGQVPFNMLWLLHAPNTTKNKRSTIATSARSIYPNHNKSMETDSEHKRGMDANLETYKI